MQLPIIEAIRTPSMRMAWRSFSGIISGLDTDTPETGGSFSNHRESKIAMATINLLQALPRHTALGPAHARRPARPGRDEL